MQMMPERWRMFTAGSQHLRMVSEQVRAELARTLTPCHTDLHTVGAPCPAAKHSFQQLQKNAGPVHVRAGPLRQLSTSVTVLEAVGVTGWSLGSHVPSVPGVSLLSAVSIPRNSRALGPSCP